MGLIGAAPTVARLSNNGHYPWRSTRVGSTKRRAVMIKVTEQLDERDECSAHHDRQTWTRRRRKMYHADTIGAGRGTRRYSSGFPYGGQ